MTPAFSAHRRADEFEALVSRAFDPGSREAQRHASLLRLVEGLRQVPDVAARPEFVGALRERLMAEADTVLVPLGREQVAAESRLAMPVRSRRRDRRLATVLGGAALLGATSTMAVASQGALPGESLYPVKRALESVQLLTATTDHGRGEALLASAEGRLGEVEQLVATGEADDMAAVPGTLDTFVEQAGEGADLLLAAHAASGDDAVMTALRDFSAESLETLVALEGQVPESVRDELVRAGRTLVDIDVRAQQACPACRGGISSIPPFLVSAVAADDGLVEALQGGVLVLPSSPAQISGQDLTGLEVPDLSGATPTSVPTSGPSATSPSSPVDKLGDALDETTDPLQETVGGTVDELDDATGGTLGELTEGVDGATGGLVGGLAGTLDDATDGTADGLTGGLLP